MRRFVIFMTAFHILHKLMLMIVHFVIFMVICKLEKNLLLVIAIQRLYICQMPEFCSLQIVELLINIKGGNCINFLIDA